MGIMKELEELNKNVNLLQKEILKFHGVSCFILGLMIGFLIGLIF